MATLTAILAAGIFLVLRTDAYTSPFLVGIVSISGSIIWGLYGAARFFIPQRGAKSPKGPTIGAQNVPAVDSEITSAEQRADHAAAESVDKNQAQHTAATEAADVSDSKADMSKPDAATRESVRDDL